MTDWRDYEDAYIEHHESDFPAAAYDSWKTTDDRDWPSTEQKSNPVPAAGFCVFCGAGLIKERTKEVPMRCARCDITIAAAHVAGMRPVVNILFCWRCGDRYAEGRCPRCELGITNEMVWAKAQEWQVSMESAKAMLIRGEAPEIAPDDELTI